MFTANETMSLASLVTLEAMRDLKRDMISGRDVDMKSVIASIRSETLAECKDDIYTFKQFLFTRYLYYMNACMRKAHSFPVFIMIHSYAGMVHDDYRVFFSAFGQTKLQEIAKYAIYVGQTDVARTLFAAALTPDEMSFIM